MLNLKTIRKFGIILLILASLVTAGYIFGDHFTKTTEIPDENRIFEKIDYDIRTIDRFSWLLTDYEIVVTNPEKFKTSAANGTVELRLLDEDVEVELQETITSTNPDISSRIKTYKGKVVGSSDSSVLLTVADDVILGKIDTGSKSYYIEQTNKKYDGKVVHVIYSSGSLRAPLLGYAVTCFERTMSKFIPKNQKGELNFTVIPEKTIVLKNETFDIHLTLTNIGENTINVWNMEEQVSYDIHFYDSNNNEVWYECGVISRVRLTNEALVELRPAQSINDTRSSKCWNLTEGEYTLNAVYHTSMGESITEPYWVGEVQSNNVTIIVE